MENELAKLDEYFSKYGLTVDQELELELAKETLRLPNQNEQ